jgi:type VI secretion system lysozyme-like protein
MKDQAMQIISPLLYRLTDTNPDDKMESDARQYISQQQLYQDIRNNLEVILNTRLNLFYQKNQLTDFLHSVINFGVLAFWQDLYSFEEWQQKICRNVRSSIGYFEPRLQNTKVYFPEKELHHNHVWLLRIEGSINIKPEPQQAVFESSLDVLRYQFIFQENRYE